MPTTPERLEIIQMIRQEVDRLPEHYRATIVLCDLQGLSPRRGSPIAGLPTGHSRPAASPAAPPTPRPDGEQGSHLVDGFSCPF